MAKEKTYTRKLTHMGSGRSYGITLPIEEIRSLGWKERQKVVIARKGKTFIIRDWKKK